MTRNVTPPSLLALAAALSLASATVIAQDAAPQPAETAPAKTAWEDLDVNKDGNLSKEETAPSPALQQVFEKADSNADGALTGDEYRTYLAAHKSEGGKPSKDHKR